MHVCGSQGFSSFLGDMCPACLCNHTHGTVKVIQPNGLAHNRCLGCQSTIGEFWQEEKPSDWIK